MDTIHVIKLCSQRKSDHFKINDIVYYLKDNEITKGYIEKVFENLYFSANINNKSYVFFIISPYFVLEKEFNLLSESKENWYSWCNQYNINIPYEKALSNNLSIDIEKDLLI